MIDEIKKSRVKFSSKMPRLTVRWVLASKRPVHGFFKLIRRCGESRRRPPEEKVLGFA